MIPASNSIINAFLQNINIVEKFAKWLRSGREVSYGKEVSYNNIPTE